MGLVHFTRRDTRKLSLFLVYKEVIREHNEMVAAYKPRKETPELNLLLAGTPHMLRLY